MGYAFDEWLTDRSWFFDRKPGSGLYWSLDEEDVSVMDRIFIRPPFSSYNRRRGRYAVLLPNVYRHGDIWRL